MDKLLASRPLAIAVSALMLLGGIALGVWAIANMPGAPSGTGTVQQATPPDPQTTTPIALATEPVTAPSNDAPLTPLPTRAPQVLVTLGAGVPASLAEVVNTFVISQTGYLTETTEPVSATVQLDIVPVGGVPVYAEVFAAATRFDQPTLELTWSDLRNNWRGRDGAYANIVVLTDTLPALTQALGEPGAKVTGVAVADDAVDAAWTMTSTITILPFDQLVPELTVLPIDGQNPVENARHFDAQDYPLSATIFAHVRGDGDQPAVDALWAALPPGNRQGDRLTVLAMTGVTAMVRRTAEQMDVRGATWPAAVVGPELAAADVTHISNEVPFVAGCETNTDLDNLTFCSKPEYLDALLATGVDIIGLTGNHQNDYGIDGALESLEFYDAAGLPVYGGGIDKAAAFVPLIVEHNGNRLGFVGANSFGPTFAWATDSTPGAAPFDLAIMSATVRNLKQRDLADVVLAELQYTESYETTPLFDQRTDFNALVRAGADIVTGVQSHVAQGLEFTDGNVILYGLGNLFFDQMNDDQVRQGLIVKHTIYDGRHLSTQLLPTVLEEYGQPRWATPAERDTILARVFGASYWDR